MLKNLVEPGLMPEDRVFRYERVDQAALDLQAGRIDVLIINSDPAQALSKEMDLKIALITSELAVGGQSVAIPEGATELKAKLDEIITQLQEEGFIDELLKQWGIP